MLRMAAGMLSAYCLASLVGGTAPLFLMFLTRGGVVDRIGIGSPLATVLMALLLSPFAMAITMAAAFLPSIPAICAAYYFRWRSRRAFAPLGAAVGAGAWLVLRSTGGMKLLGTGGASPRDVPEWAAGAQIILAGAVAGVVFGYVKGCFEPRQEGA